MRLKKYRKFKRPRGGQMNVVSTQYSSGSTVQNQDKNGHSDWQNLSDELSQWAIAKLLSRRDTFPEWDQPSRSWKRRYKAIWNGKLKAHFSGFTTIGAYTTNPTNNTCKYLGIDIDAHDDDLNANAAANWFYALKLYHRLKEFGMKPLLEDSNNKGGFHVWVVFATPVDAETIHRFGCWLTQDAPADIHIEVFPKQTDIDDRFGNQLRLPGRHHKHGTWSRFYDEASDELVGGGDGISILLGTGTSDHTLIPHDALVFRPQAQATKPQPKPIVISTYEGDEWWRQYKGNLATLDMEKLCEDRLTGTSSGLALEIICPWCDEHTTGEGGAYIWNSDGTSWGSFYCHHSHCADRRLVDLLEFYGQEDVDANCAEEWREPDPVPDIPPEIHAAISQWDDPYSDDERSTSETTWVKPATPITFESWGETQKIADNQEDDWLIPQWAEFGCLLLFTGMPFAGKSTIIAEILACIATGNKFAGMPVEQVPFILVDLENRERTLVRRLRSALNGEDGRMAELYHRVNPRNIPRPITDDWVRECIRSLQASMESTGAEKGVVIVDTFRSAYAGSGKSEMDPTEMVDLLVPLKTLAMDTNWLVIVLHHNAKYSNAYSGSTAIAAVADYMWNWQVDVNKLEGTLIWDGGRGDRQESLKFNFNMESQRNIFAGTASEVKRDQKQTEIDTKLAEWMALLPTREQDALSHAEIHKKALDHGIEKVKSEITARKRTNELFDADYADSKRLITDKTEVEVFWLNNNGIDFLQRSPFSVNNGHFVGLGWGENEAENEGD